jgi:predicted TIM-barrel fold metal-dependent hydrolase
MRRGNRFAQRRAHTGGTGASAVTINDAHCHFFSAAFFDALARQRGHDEDGADLCRELGWDDPGAPDALADRWVAELDAHGVERAALIASVPGDEESVAVAAARHPDRCVGLCMLDPTADGAAHRASHALTALGLRGVCLFPAMHGFSLESREVRAVVEAAAGRPGSVVFVHCGKLSVGVRAKLGLASRFDLRRGQPLDLLPLAQAFPDVPFLVPHFGAGLLRETLLLADACPNVYLDTSSSNRWMDYTPGLTLDAVFRAAVAVAGPGRLVFGTDSSFFPRGWQRGVCEVQRRAMDAAGLDEDAQAAVLGGTFDRLFPLR